ncbi:MAG: hypothetical protein AB7I42_24865 [Bradyrhizobium sp.]|uniref:phage tail fiber protein n=1 Tax=Bradyrhizobium sp. TaxID=376 RepID=UPI003D09F3AB
MTLAMTRALQQGLGNHVLGIASYAMPTGLSLSLHTQSPTEDGLATWEVSGGGYARADITGLMSPANVSTGISRLDNVVNIGPATTGWGTITHAGIHNQIGTMLFYGALAPSQTTTIGQQFQLTPGQLTVSIGEAATLWLIKKLLDHVLVGIEWTMPSAIQLALHLASPTSSGSVAAEVSGSGYSRAPLTGLMSGVDLASGVSTLSIDVSIGPAGDDWGTITDGSLHDQDGNMLIFGQGQEAQIIPIGESFRLRAGSFAIPFR